MCNQNIQKCEDANGGTVCSVFEHACKIRNRIQEVINGNKSVTDFLAEDLVNHLFLLLILLKDNKDQWSSWGVSKHTICQLVKAFRDLGAGVVRTHLIKEIHDHVQFLDCPEVPVSNPEALINGVLVDMTCCLERNYPDLFTLEFDQCGQNNACKKS